ncbi:Nucleic-acid-binding protein transposon like protein [Argiope bruennichi]|uniref:Nucleic-acid-binding protein transposon like protein n=1 Tax=Argiope bruennichi TaxID=94029 RepID=A0A8T0FF35_ARGBR|nr:Nucleic-acid-binding protein transposon like protein [Argiope bruennichi]
MPPIMLRRIAEYPVLLKRINTVQKIKCTAKETGEFVKLFVDTTDDVRKLTKYLEEQNLEYYVISDKAEKPVKIVIKGLPINTDVEEIKNELTQLDYQVQKVNQFRKFKTKELLPIFQIHLSKTPNIQDIYKIDQLMYMVVRVEKYVNKTVRQCYKCQTWQHTSQQCGMKPKCVICAGQHESLNCPNKVAKSEEEKLPVKCANCGGPHTASYKGCPKYPKIDRKVTPGASYASIAQRNNNAVTDNPRGGKSKQEGSRPPRDQEIRSEQETSRRAEGVNSGGIPTIEGGVQNNMLSINGKLCKLI